MEPACIFMSVRLYSERANPFKEGVCCLHTRRTVCTCVCVIYTGGCWCECLSWGVQHSKKKKKKGKAMSPLCRVYHVRACTKIFPTVLVLCKQFSPSWNFPPFFFVLAGLRHNKPWGVWCETDRFDTNRSKQHHWLMAWIKSLSSGSACCLVSVNSHPSANETSARVIYRGQNSRKLLCSKFWRIEKMYVRFHFLKGKQSAVEKVDSDTWPRSL